MTDRDNPAENPAEPSADPAAEGSNTELTATGATADQQADADAPQNRRARRAAAARARQSRGQEQAQVEAQAIGLDAQEMIDEALTRNTAQASRWLRQNSGLLQGIVATGLIAWSGWGIYQWRSEASRAKTSDLIAKAVISGRAEIGDPDKVGQPNEQGVVDPSPVYKDVPAKEQATLEAFEAAVKLRSGTPAGAFAELGLAASQLDAKKWDDALTHFEAVRTAAAVKTAPELRCRALEGAALAQEGKGDNAAARKTCTELAGSECSNAAVGLYCQARLAHAAGDLEGAKAAATELNAKLAKKAAPEDPYGFSGGYLRQGAKLLNDVLGITPPAPSAEPKGITQEQLRRMQQEVQNKINQAGKGSK